MKLPIHIHATYSPHSKEWSYTTYNCDLSSMAGFGQVVEVREIDFTPPEESSLVDNHVAILKAEQQRIRADAEVKFQNIEQQIQELLCLPAAEKEVK